MKNLKILLCLTLVSLLLVHCENSKDDGPQTPPAGQTTPPGTGTPPEPPPQQGVSQDITCITGVYSGRGDLRWNSLNGSFWDGFNQNIKVAIILSGNSALVRVDGEDGDILCTHYEDVQGVEEDGITTLNAIKITSSREEGDDWLYSSSLAQSLAGIQITQPNYACNFNIGSISPKNINEKNTNSIQSANLERTNDPVDFNTLLASCGGIESFEEIALPQEEAEEADSNEAS